MKSAEPFKVVPFPTTSERQKSTDELNRQIDDELLQKDLNHAMNDLAEQQLYEDIIRQLD